MSFDARVVVGAILIGIGATVVMDVWNLFLARAFRDASLDLCLLGRWLLHMPRVLRHESIAKAQPMARECAVGWLAHYGIGVTLALVFVGVVSGDWLDRPTPWPALAYGIVTVVFPLFLLQPSLGLGVAASRTPHPARARLKSLTTHMVFGVGLYLSALAVTSLLPLRG